LDWFLIYQSVIYFINLIATVVQMQIYARNLIGRLIPLKVKSSDTIINVKKKIQEKEGIPVEQQRLILGNHLLDDNLTLANYNIQEKSIIHLVIRLTGS
jgi:ubiquitin